MSSLKTRLRPVISQLPRVNHTNSKTLLEIPPSCYLIYCLPFQVAAESVIEGVGSRGSPVTGRVNIWIGFAEDCLGIRRLANLLVIRGSTWTVLTVVLRITCWMEWEYFCSKWDRSCRYGRCNVSTFSPWIHLQLAAAEPEGSTVRDWIQYELVEVTSPAPRKMVEEPAHTEPKGMIHWYFARCVQGLWMYTYAPIYRLCILANWIRNHKLRLGYFRGVASRLVRKRVLVWCYRRQREYAVLMGGSRGPGVLFASGFYRQTVSRWISYYSNCLISWKECLRKSTSIGPMESGQRNMFRILFLVDFWEGVRWFWAALFVLRRHSKRHPCAPICYKTWIQGMHKQDTSLHPPGSILR